MWSTVFVEIISSSRCIDSREVTNPIYIAIIKGLADQGKSVAVFSSELEEVLGICDRVFLMYDGRIQAEIKNGTEVDIQHILEGVQH